MRAAAASIVLLAASTASADSITVTTTTTVDIDPVFQPPAETPPVTHPAPTLAPDVRVTVAAGPALGFDTKDDCANGECFALHAQVGGKIASRLLLLASGSLMMAPDAKDRHHVATLSLQAWATSRWWGELGLGVGSKRSRKYTEASTMDPSSVAPAGTAAIGFEALRRPTYSFGIQARVGSTIDVHHTSFGQLLVGVSWY